MKWYRLVDEFNRPYHAWYNETDLEALAWIIHDIINPDEFIDPDGIYEEEKIYEGLLAWERDFIIFVEEAGEPFSKYDEYGWDDEGHNWSEEEIIQYANTRNDLKYYDEELMVEYVWHGWHGDKPLSEILDEFSMVNYKEELFDDLNNMLFNTYDEVVEAIQKWMAEEKGLDWDRADCAELASEFVDNKELYDISYD